MTRFFVLSGASSGGKSTLLAALAAQGIHTVEEPGRRIVAAALAGDGAGLPWSDPTGFARRALDLSLRDWDHALTLPGPVVFDRGLIDAVAAFEHLTGTLPPEAAGLSARYAETVLMLPPWPEIYRQDRERRHTFAEAEAEYARLLAFLPRFGYRPVILPRVPVAERTKLAIRLVAGAGR